jgi:hypothetical protein
MESVTVEEGWVFIWANNAHYSCVGHTWVWKEDLGDVVWSGGILWTVGKSTPSSSNGVGGYAILTSR